MTHRIYIVLLWLIFTAVSHGGAIVYPGDGNIDFREGALELWITPRFETEQAVEKTVYPATFFTVDFPGDPRKNYLALTAWQQPKPNREQYNALRLSLWADGQGHGGPAIPLKFLKKGIPCRIGMTWANGELKLYVDYRLIWQGTFYLPYGKIQPDNCYILIGGRSVLRGATSSRELMLPEVLSAVRVSAIRIGAVARDLTEKEADGVLRDTLLYDSFSAVDRQKRITKPTVISSRLKSGRLTGGCTIFDNEIDLGKR